MEVLKKTILQAVTTGITACTGTTGICNIIIPNIDAIYYMKIGLKQEAYDIGFFDAFGYGGYGSYGSYGGETYGIGESLLMDENYI